MRFGIYAESSFGQSCQHGFHFLVDPIRVLATFWFVLDSFSDRKILLNELCITRICLVILRLKHFFDLGRFFGRGCLFIMDFNHKLELLGSCHYGCWSYDGSS